MKVMLGSVLLVLLALSRVVSGKDNSSYVSFYGDGYLRLPTHDARSDTNVTLSFRTSQSASLLFLAAGSTDYCVVTLQSGAVRAKIDLGSGDANLVSPPGLVFNDLQWHTVRLRRTQATVTLTVDGMYAVQATTPGSFFELNIDRDIFVGGTGGSDADVYFGNFIEFRGCMRDVTFNGNDVISSAHALSYTASVAYAVDWQCSSTEFNAASDRAMSFPENTSFVAFPSLGPRRDVRLTFDLRSRSATGIVLFNSGGHFDSDFLAVELVDGHVTLRVDKGAGTVAMTSSARVDDGRWHQVEVFIDAVTVRLSVDGIRREERTSYGTARLLDVGTARLYLGGVGVSGRAAAIDARLDSLAGVERAAAGSLQGGCIQNFKIDGQLFGLREAVITRSIRVDCVWTEPCLRSPCVAGAQCVDDGLDRFRCLCDHVEDCYRPSGSSDPSLPLDQLVRVRDLVVREGGRSPLTDANIALAASLGNPADDSVAFRVLVGPSYGELFLSGVGRRKQTGAAETFTLADIKEGRVFYVHDGSEATSDSFQLEMNTTGTERGIQNRKYSFSVVVQIAAWNDRPAISLPPGDTLSVIAGTQILVGPEILNATDDDDPASSLELTVQYQPGVDFGYFEISDTIGVRARVTRFTQADVDAGRVKFVHRGAAIQQLRLQVSDGKDVGEPRVLNVVATPLRVTSVANNGLVVPRGSTRYISRANLTFVTNAAAYQNIDVLYRVLEPPFDGEIQRRQYTDDTWSVTSEFAQSHVDAQRVRYVHFNDSRSRGDFFRFRASAHGADAASEEQEFHIRVVNARVEVLRSAGLRLGGSRDSAVVTADQLKATSSIPYHGPTDLVYRVVAAPRVGNLMKADETTTSGAGGRVQRRKMVPGSSFTQADVNDGRMLYRLTKLPEATVRDGFEFRVSAPGVDESASIMFSVLYEPDGGDVRIVNNGLMDVMEGSAKAIGMDDLWVERKGATGVQFVVVEGPRHGSLQIVNPTNGNVIRQNVTSFAATDVRDQRLRYVHDDSESQDDSFRFRATVTDGGVAGTVEGDADGGDGNVDEVTGTFEIKIALKNDNAPRRLVDRPFYVVDGGGRTLRLDDIAFTDPDVDFDSSLLEYEWRDLTNGYVVSGENHQVPLHQFTQRDLANGLVHFRHRPTSGDAGSTVWVSDGVHFSTGQLMIRASEPFVRTGNGSLLVVERGQRVALTPSNFAVETNIDAADRDFRFVVVEPPYNGIIRRNGVDKHRFTMADVKAGAVTYEHTGNGSGSAAVDDFRFVVRVGEAQARGEVVVSVVDAAIIAKRQRLRVINNVIALVDAFESTALSPDVLNVTCTGSRPRDVTFTVTSGPRFGVLTSSSSEARNPPSLTTFSQDDVNGGKVLYDHHDDAGGKYSDYFRFDVRCGEERLRGLELVIDVIPVFIPLETGNTSVRFSSSVMLNEGMFTVGRKQFEVAELEFLVVRRPSFGQIRLDERPTTSFTLGDLRIGRVDYVHMGQSGATGKDGSGPGKNGTEPLVATADSFSVVARLAAGDRQSQPRTVHVTILPKNEQPPHLVNRKTLHVYIGSSSVITRENLLVEDIDTGSNDIVYSLLTSPVNGDVIVEGEGVTSSFTQQQINDGKVVFAHRGTDDGSLEFDVTDGLIVLHQLTLHIDVSQPQLTVSVCGPLFVFPTVDQPVTSTVLQTNSSDTNQSRTIVYSVVTSPRNGRLVMTSLDDPGADVTSFTQNDLEAGTLVYRPTVAPTSFRSTVEDWISLDVSSAYASSLRNVSLPVNISYVNLNADNAASLVTSRGLGVDEGGAAIITKSDLDVGPLARHLADVGPEEVWFVVERETRRGRLAITGGINATVGHRLSQRDITRRDVIYVHDGSDTTEDDVLLGVEVDTGNGNRLQLDHVITFSITVRPINDEPFVILTQTPGFQILQGETLPIGRDTLETVDADTPPEGLLYEISSAVSNGRVINTDRPNQAIDKFTQRDINAGKIAFVQDGSRESGAFYIKVSDGQHKPLFKVFDIKVIPLSLALSSVTDVILQQGDLSAVINTSHVILATNGRPDRVYYNVTRGPAYGQLFRNDLVVQRFSQADLVNGSIIYVQFDLSSAVDNFEFLVYDIENLIPPQQLNIVVRPRLKKSKHPLKVDTNSSSVVLDLHALDASDLQALTNSVPVYYVTSAPTRGTLQKTNDVTSGSGSGSSSRKPREAAAQGRRKDKQDKKRKKGGGGPRDGMSDKRPSYISDAVLNFTHDDVINGRVLYHPLLTPTGSTSALNDAFSFVLTARNAQPVADSVTMEILPPPVKMMTSNALMSQPTEPPTAEAGGKAVDVAASGRVGKDHVMIVVLVAVLTVLAVVGLIVFRCVRRRRAAKRRKYELAAAIEASAAAAAAASGPPSVGPEMLSSQSSPADSGISRSRPPPPPPPIIQPPIIIEPPPLDSREGTPLDLENDKPISAVIPNAVSSPQDATSSRAGYVRIVPPLPPVAGSSPGGGPGGPVRNGAGPPGMTPGDMGSVWKEQVTFDWEHVDPELLQHCRKTNPVLHKNQYWV